jgi:hypothetical protein
MSEQNRHLSNELVKNSPSKITYFPLVDLTSGNKTTDNDTKPSLAREPVNLISNNNNLEKRKHVIEIGESEMVLKLNQKILECIERDDRDKADEYKECLKECLASFSLSKRHQSDISPGLASLTKHPSNSISANNSGLETRIPPQEKVNRLPAVNAVKVLKTQSQPSEKKKFKFWSKREEWMLVVGDLRVPSMRSGTKFDKIKAMFKPELDRFTNSSLGSKLSLLKNKNPDVYKSMIKAQQFEDLE